MTSASLLSVSLSKSWFVFLSCKESHPLAGVPPLLAARLVAPLDGHLLEYVGATDHRHAQLPAERCGGCCLS